MLFSPQLYNFSVGKGCLEGHKHNTQLIQAQCECVNRIHFLSVVKY